MNKETQSSQSQSQKQIHEASNAHEQQRHLSF